MNAAWDEENEREIEMSRQILYMKNLKKPGDDVVEEFFREQKILRVLCIFVRRCELLRISHTQYFLSYQQSVYIFQDAFLLIIIQLIVGITYKHLA